MPILLSRSLLIRSYLTSGLNMVGVLLILWLSVNYTVERYTVAVYYLGPLGCR